jgi:hypothetical protein
MAAVAFKVKLADGTEMGPLDIQMLRSWYQQGLVNRESRVRRSGAKTWQRLFEVVDIQSWGAAGGTKGRGEQPDEDDFGADDPQTWRTWVASAILFLVAGAAGYFTFFPARFLPALSAAPWREIALGFVALGLLLVSGRPALRKVARVLVFLLTFSLFAVAAPVIMQGFHWRPIAVLVSAWVMGSGLFFFLAGRALPWKSVALCLFWILAGAAGVGALGFIPADGITLASAAESAEAAKAAAAATWSPSAAAVSRDLPMLTPRAAELVVSYGLDRPESAFRLSYLLAANGVSRLSPSEAKELGQLTTALYAPLPPANRKRLDGYMERVRGLQVTQAQEDREMSALVREAVLQFPDPQRTRYQSLYEKALGLSQ